MKIALTVERLREVLRYDPETGLFYWKSPSTKKKVNKRIFDGRIAGTTSHGRRQICVDKKIYRAHRLAWLYMYGEWPMRQIDHINGDPLDNRIANLRDVSITVNHQNQRRAHRRNKTGLLGVSANRQGFRARIDHKHIGTFSTPELAHQAYLQAKRQTHEGNTL